VRRLQRPAGEGQPAVRPDPQRLRDVRGRGAGAARGAGSTPRARARRVYASWPATPPTANAFHMDRARPRRRGRRALHGAWRCRGSLDAARGDRLRQRARHLDRGPKTATRRRPIKGGSQGAPRGSSPFSSNQVV
jgi:hypothetical protein